MSLDFICALMFLIFVALPAALFYVYVGIFVTGVWNGWKTSRHYRSVVEVRGRRVA